MHRPAHKDRSQPSAGEQARGESPAGASPDRFAPALPVGGRGWPSRLPAEGPGGGPAGLVLPGGTRAGTAPVSVRSARDLGGGRRALLPPKGPPAVPPNHPLHGRPAPGRGATSSGRFVPPRLSHNGVSLPSTLPAAERGAAVPARGAAERSCPRRGPEGSGAPGPPCPSPGAVAANSRDSVFGGGNKPHPTSPTVMFVTACPSLGVERSMTGLCCLNKNQWQLKGEDSSY